MIFQFRFSSIFILIQHKMKAFQRALLSFFTIFKLINCSPCEFSIPQLSATYDLSTLQITGSSNNFKKYHSLTDREQKYKYNFNFCDSVLDESFCKEDKWTHTGYCPVDRPEMDEWEDCPLQLEAIPDKGKAKNTLRTQKTKQKNVRAYVRNTTRSFRLSTDD